ncbi:hypothetical protein BCF74_104109 [Knoellia remsis]|uniref:Uncharacterized protein n=1 Tax=Knoellia remsis TaxID=407159 RepID=A0A2T0UXM2_9MICO|nr:hypothetical protein [Knoellia remsis]PRY62673.1 hypothetical protein BCF74_104109 [Knoellia remsis]
MNVIDTLRIESAIQRYDFWLEMRGVAGKRRRELQQELRTNLREASADVGTTRALFGIGSPKQLAHAATETDPSRPRWSQGAMAAVLTLLVLSTWLALTSLTVLDTADAAQAGGPVSVSPFPWFGTTFTVESTAERLALSVTGMWQLVAGPTLAFLAVAQPWRLLRRKGSRG